MDWDTYFISEAYLAARKSKDPSTQVGAVIVGPDREIRSKGYNGPCRGDDDSDPACWERPLKEALVEHAERNAIYNAARIGVSCRGCVLYTTYHPCIDCARGIVQSGITEVVIDADFPGSPHFRTSAAQAAALFMRCGVTRRLWHGRPEVLPVRCGGVLYAFSNVETG